MQKNVYVVKDLHTTLLGHLAILKLNLVAQLDSVDANILKRMYPKYKPNKELILSVDASLYSLGLALLQKEKKQ